MDWTVWVYFGDDALVVAGCIKYFCVWYVLFYLVWDLVVLKETECAKYVGVGVCVWPCAVSVFSLVMML